MAGTERNESPGASGGPSSATAGKPGSADPLRRSRTSGFWAAIVALGVVLVLLIVFIAQNTQSVEISFLGWTGNAPLSVAMLISAVAGLFLAVVGGTLRIVQLRRRVGRLKKETAASK